MVYNGLKEAVPFHKSGTIIPKTSAYPYVSAHHHIFVARVEL